MLMQKEIIQRNMQNNYESTCEFVEEYFDNLFWFFETKDISEEQKEVYRQKRLEILTMLNDANNLVNQKLEFHSRQHIK